MVTRVEKEDDDDECRVEWLICESNSFVYEKNTINTIIANGRTSSY